MNRTAFATALACLTAYAVLGAQQHPMKPGRWDVTATMQMGTMNMPPVNNSQCITAEDLKKASEGGMPAGVDGPGQQNNCKVSDYKMTADTVTWKMECTGQRAATGEGKMTFTGDTYTGVMTMTMPQGVMTMNSSGKWMGPCSK